MTDIAKHQVGQGSNIQVKKKKNIEGSKMQRKKNESGKKGSYDRRGKGGRHVCAVRECLGVCRP